jgi:phage baseplate assembly protein W
MKGFSVKSPLKYDLSDGHYQMNKTLKEVVNQNFRDLLLTNPGERIMDPDYGIGVKTLLFHQRTDFFSEIDIKSLILEKTRIYMPFLSINTIEVLDNIPEDLNSMAINIEYSLPSLKEKDKISLILNQN